MIAGTNPVIEAIKTRRSVRRIRQDQSPSKDAVSALLEAATWAPNHHMTEPWRFVVIAGDDRIKLAEVMTSAYVAAAGATPPPPEGLEKERNRPLTAPVIIALISSPRRASNVIPQEETVAAGAAMQNLLLAAHSMGLGANVRTGAHAYSDAVRRFLEMREGESLVGFVYLGYPLEPPLPGKRTGLQGKVTWRGM
jgi:nitroreductase